MKSEKLSEIEALVESVVRGERVVIFPPGFWAVIAAIMLFIGSTVMLSGMLISIYGQNIEVGEKVFFQFLGLVAILIFVIIPGLMVFRGHRRISLVLKGYGWILITGNLVLIFIMFKLPVLLSLVLASFAVYLIGSRWFRNCSEFYFLINQSRKFSK
jgi:hypothetical protein